MAAHLYFDAGFEEVGEAVGQTTEAGGDGLPAHRSALARGVVAAEGDDFLDVADRQALGDDPRGQALLRGGVVQAEEGASMACAEHARGDPLLHRRGEIEQPEGITDVRARSAYLARELLVGGAEIVEELLVGCGLFQRVELLAVHVLDQGVPEQVVVLRLLDDGADLGQPSTLSGTPPPFAHDKLVPARPGRANHYRLQEADLSYGFRELVECLLVEHPPRLAGVRRYG